MPIESEFLFIASMDVDPEREALFNEVYDDEHVPSLAKVPGVVSATRFRTEPFTLQIGGQITQMTASSPLYIALYELESPEVLTSPEWSTAVESGRWPSQVRGFTRNRHHSLMKRI